MLSARGITKSFGGALANDGVHLDLGAGEIHALLGENGAGKTTLISVLCGQYRPEAGSVAVRGRELALGSPRAALRAGIGVVHQDFRLVPRFTVVENVVLGTPAWGSRAAAARVADVARQLGFTLDPWTRVWELSVGEQQQVAILRLLYRGLDILILDEPTAVLSPQQAEQLFASLRRLAGEGKAVLLITHRLQEVTEAADRVTVLRGGRVVASQPVRGLTHRDLAALMVGHRPSPPPAPARRSAGEPVLRLEDVWCSAGRGLKGVDLAVRRGEILGVAGVSGNGQRELAELSAGILEAERGRRWAAARTVRFIPEDRLETGLVGGMSISENLALRQFGLPSISRPWWLARRRLAELAERLIAAGDVPVHDPAAQVADLSGGGLQRVLLARELDQDPDLIVAAQPTRGLDVASAQAVRARLVAAGDRGAGVLLISEDLDEILELSDRVLVMFRGRIVGELDPRTASRAEVGLLMAGGS